LSAYIYSGANASESSTDVTFSGHLIISENGNLLKESRKFSFESDTIISDIDLGKIRSERHKLKSFADCFKTSHRAISIDSKFKNIYKLDYPFSDTPFVPKNKLIKNSVSEEILEIQSTALAKRLKHIGTINVTIGISGGLDSTLALIVCKKAFEKLKLNSKGIHSIVMPGPGSSAKTQENAEKLAKLLGSSFIKIDISHAVNKHLKDIDHTDHNYDITYENAQARERTQILMDYANKVSGITIGTGDLSELALGWCTYNADQVSMYGVNAGVPKTLVKYLIEYYSEVIDNTDLKNILLEIINQPISPELIPADKDGNISQLTEEKVGPYILNDFFLFYFLRYNYSIKKIFYLSKFAFEAKFDEKIILHWLEQFIKRFVSSQFKRSMMPDGIKVGSIALSPRADLRMPSDASKEIWLNEIKKIKENEKW
jgi:NAD+ synthase (glutamine-hydrolysing)